MSAPTAAVLLAEHAGQMLVEIGRELGRDSLNHVRVRIEYSTSTTQPFHVWIDEGGNSFHGEDTDAGRALMDANSKRQTFHENCKRQMERMGR
jgi:hypothetical protein